jgi:hypothetical protein
MLLERKGDDVASYEHELVDLPGDGRGPILKRRPNGDCVYPAANIEHKFHRVT